MLTAHKKVNYIHRIFSSLNKWAAALLMVALFGWLYCPILGVIPLLLLAQVKVSQRFKGQKPKKMNIGINIESFCVLITLFTLVICASTYFVQSDLREYVDIYARLGEMPFFDQMRSTNDGTEPITFIIPSILKPLLGDNGKVFLLTQAFTLNIAYITLSIWFLPEYYPLIIILNVTSTNYFLQLFLMRQYYAAIFLIPLICIQPYRTKAFTFKTALLALSLATHSTSIFLGFPILLFQTVKFSISNFFSFMLPANSSFKASWKKKIFLDSRMYRLLNGKFVILLFLAILAVAFPTLLSFSTKSNIVSSVAPVLAERVNRYEVAESGILGISSELWQGIHLIDVFFIGLSLFLIDLRKVNNLCQAWTFMFMVSILAFLGVYFVLPALGRATLLFTGLTGFFYAIPLYSGKITNKPNTFSLIIFVAIFVKSVSFYYRIINTSMNTTSMLWNGKPLDANLVEYIRWIVQS